MPFMILIHIPNFNDAHHLFQGREFKRIETRSPRDEKFRLFIGREVKAFFDIFFFLFLFLFFAETCRALSRLRHNRIVHKEGVEYISDETFANLFEQDFQKRSETIDPCRFSMYNMAGLTGTRPTHRKNNNHECVRRTRKL